MQPDDPKPSSSYWSRSHRNTLGGMVTVGSIFFVGSPIAIGYALIVGGRVPLLFAAVAAASAAIAWIGYRKGGRFFDTLDDDGKFPEERGPWRWF
jgi:hypothetical protein